MKKFSFFSRSLCLEVGFIVLLAVFSIAQAQGPVPGQIMIDIKHEYLPISPTPNGQGVMITGLASLDSVNVLYQVHTFEKLTDDSWSATKGFYVLRFPDSVDVNLVHSSYSTDIHIHLAGLTGFRYPDVTPGDYYFSRQWGLSKIKCPEAWRHTNGSKSIIIQIIDGGTDYGHPDLVHNIWQNLGEDVDGDGHTIEWDPVQNRWVLDPGDLNGNDDDFNGYPDDLVGWDFLYGDRDPSLWDGGIYPWLDHGDKTAGTAAAVTDNWISPDEAEWVCDHDTGTVAGTSWFSKIMIARFSGNDQQAIKAIHYGRNKGAKIISMSWGSSDDYPPLHAALDSAWNEGILLVASAGNDSSEIIHYPAAYSSVIAVAATDNNDVKTDYSNYGTWVDICAPGSNNSPSRDNKWWDYYCYENWGGTSAFCSWCGGSGVVVQLLGNQC